ncbi:hypothetical protein [Pedobacter flavus]|uniref:Glycosyltransferase n=1 Tax=Pedobacter flavus TaxID=3113906 RepID=A0ABU7H0D5_9SPHI|nr:hypothetical protein [Pedobacter sp. VNH31]MEE1884706.1 hypothetical protein [Pedobacter sp. VNH31]
MDRDPRILRQIQILSETFDVTTAGLSSSQHANEMDFIQIKHEYILDFHLHYPALLRKIITLFVVYPSNIFRKFFQSYWTEKMGDFEKIYWTPSRRITLNKLIKNRFHLVIANDLETLPLAIKIKEINGSYVYFDAHEYSPLEYENNEEWLKNTAPYCTYLCKKYIPMADYNTTVSHGLAVEYKRLTNKEFDVVLNAPSFENIIPSENSLNKIRFIHHGGISPDRNTDKLIQAFIDSKRGDIELNLMLVGLDSPYGEKLKELAAGQTKIIFHQPVPTKEIAKYINQFDVGIYFLPPLNFNQVHALPNKFFEFIQGRLMLAMGPSIEMVKYIEEYNLGLVGKGFETKDILDCINSIKKEDIEFYKSNVHKSARILSSEDSMEQLKKKLISLFV